MTPATPLFSPIPPFFASPDSGGIGDRLYSTLQRVSFISSRVYLSRCSPEITNNCFNWKGVEKTNLLINSKFTALSERSDGL